MTSIKPIVDGTLDYSGAKSGVNLDLSTLVASDGWAIEVSKVIGSNYDDVIIGNNTPYQTLNGGGGDDILVGIGFKTTYNGGDGSDTVDYSQLGSVSVDLNQHFSSRGETFNRIENVTGGAGNDTIIGTDGNNVLTGGGGSDVLDGGAGADTMIGGAGDDIYYVDNRGDAVIELPGQGMDEVDSSISYGLGKSTENLMLTGNTAVSGLGNELDNRIFGNSASNVLKGFGGNDIVRGGASRDVIDGGVGNDIIYGGAGPDELRGGAGEDVFTYNSASETLTYGRDRIIDFEQNTDMIDLRLIDANVRASGNQAFTFIGSDDFSHSVGELRYDHFSNYTLVSGDTNGDATADFAIKLENFTSNLKATDFYL